MLEIVLSLVTIAGGIALFGCLVSAIQLLAVRSRIAEWHLVGEAAIVAWAFVLDLHPGDDAGQPTAKQIDRAAQFVRETVGRQVPEAVIYNALYGAWMTIPRRHRHREEEPTPFGGGFGEGWTQ